LRAQVFAGLRALLQKRRASAAFHPGGHQEIVQHDPRLFVLRRTSRDGRESMLCVHNISAQSIETEFPLLDAAPDDARLVLAPYAVVWSRLRASRK
jgi:sucrose phosphorylase